MFLRSGSSHAKLGASTWLLLSEFERCDLTLERCRERLFSARKRPVPDGAGRSLNCFIDPSREGEATVRNLLNN